MQVPDIHPGGDFPVVRMLPHVEEAYQCGKTRAFEVPQWDGGWGLQSQPAGGIHVRDDPFNERP